MDDKLVLQVIDDERDAHGWTVIDHPTILAMLPRLENEGLIEREKAGSNTVRTTAAGQIHQCL